MLLHGVQLKIVEKGISVISLYLIYNEGIKESSLTRLEMATLLCMADRQHSQLMDLMPEKSGMTGHGKELFEPTLKEV